MQADIEKFVKCCKHCAETAPNPIKEPLHPWPEFKSSWDRIHMDFAGPIQGHWFLVIVDSYSRFVDAEWFSTITATATCKYLRRLFFKYGPPKVVVSDNGTQFTAIEFAQLCTEFNIIHLRSPGHPQSNGLAERMVNTLKRSLELQVLSKRETKMNQILYTYNYTPCEAVPGGKSPAEIFFGRKFRTPLDIFTVTEKPRPILSHSQRKMKKHFDTHHGAKTRRFFPGQQVLVQLSNGRRVPGKIVNIIGSTIARIKVDNGLIKRHFNQIWNRTVSPSERTDGDAEDLLPTMQNPTADPPPCQLPFEGANFASNVDPPAQAREEPTVRRSNRLAGDARPDYRKLAGFRPYDKHSA
ncbi:PREDICTED: uncharacterized protein K02A2.6-like [Trachymyrmex cornetzi]|uniref:uncharacterized protein K02A2.6-like n=1 Tax=Trachymyrmex cornetzi TaxID=471704 RepID=UPI00084F6104|nr:PREDICTED: uncharacterized protein K02A2.6-like [Trachymyrmex cornetzi]